MAGNLTFHSTAPLTINPSNSRPVLIVRPDGTKVLGAGKPVSELNREELLALVDDLCAVMMGARHG